MQFIGTTKNLHLLCWLPARQGRCRAALRKTAVLPCAEISRWSRARAQPPYGADGEVRRNTSQAHRSGCLPGTWFLSTLAR
jgi:hypothetical protein